MYISCFFLWNFPTIFMKFRRNDFISHVREAAQLALQQIGGEEAQKAIDITQVLSQEIKDLAQETNAEGDTKT